jgi:hypothetical protein
MLTMDGDVMLLTKDGDVIIRWWDGRVCVGARIGRRIGMVRWYGPKGEMR